MTCKIISPQQKQEFQGLISVVLPAYNGEMQILPGHAESFVKLQEGILVLRNKGENSLPISDGICYIKNDEILITL